MTRFLIPAAAAALLFVSTATAQDAPKAEQAAPVEKLAPKAPRVSGKLLALDGTTGWAGRLIRVTPMGTLTTLGVMTDREGSFSLPHLAPGKYLISAGKLTRTLTIVEGQPLQPLVLLASRDVLAADALPMGQAVASSGGSAGVSGLAIAGFIIGSAAAVAAGVSAVILIDRIEKQRKHQEEEDDQQARATKAELDRIAAEQAAQDAKSEADKQELQDALDKAIADEAAANQALQDAINANNSSIQALQNEIDLLKNELDNLGITITNP